MTTPATPSRQTFSEKYLDPGARISEVLFGLIMVLTYTLTAGLTVSEGKEGVRQLLAAAIGCNVAWGIIDGVFYVMGQLFARGRRLRLAQALRAAPDEDAAVAAVGRELDDSLESVTSADERRRLYRGIVQTVSRTEPPKNGIRREDLYGALASFWLVFFSALPAAVPFLIFRSEPRFALRVSNGLLLVMLFLVGFKWADYTGDRRLVTGIVMTLVGATLVATAIVLGG